MIDVCSGSDGTLLRSIHEHAGIVYTLEPHPINPCMFMSAGYDGLVALWDISQAAAIYEHRLDTQLTDARFAPAGDAFAVVDTGAFLSVFATGSTDSYSQAPIYQYYTRDYMPLSVDDNGFVIDTDAQIAPHLIPPGPLCYGPSPIFPHPNQPGVPFRGFIAPPAGELESHLSRLDALKEHLEQSRAPIPTMPQSLLLRNSCRSDVSSQRSTSTAATADDIAEAIEPEEEEAEERSFYALFSTLSDESDEEYVDRLARRFQKQRLQRSERLERRNKRKKELETVSDEEENHSDSPAGSAKRRRLTKLSFPLWLTVTNHLCTNTPYIPQVFCRCCTCWTLPKSMAFKIDVCVDGRPCLHVQNWLSSVF